MFSIVITSGEGSSQSLVSLAPVLSIITAFISSSISSIVAFTSLRNSKKSSNRDFRYKLSADFVSNVVAVIKDIESDIPGSKVRNGNNANYILLVLDNKIESNRLLYDHINKLYTTYDSVEWVKRARELAISVAKQIRE